MVCVNFRSLRGNKGSGQDQSQAQSSMHGDTSPGLCRLDTNLAQREPRNMFSGAHGQIREFCYPVLLEITRRNPQARRDDTNGEDWAIVSTSTISESAKNAYTGVKRAYNFNAGPAAL